MCWLILCPAIFPMVCPRVPFYPLPYIIYSLPIFQMRVIARWPRLLMTLQYLFRTKFRKWFAVSCKASLTLFLIISRIGRFESILQQLKRSFLLDVLAHGCSRRLTFASHTAKAIDKTEKAFRILYSFINRKSKLCVHNKFLLYKTCIRPILCYGDETWFVCSYAQEETPNYSE
jgi:hypothetical protein